MIKMKYKFKNNNSIFKDLFKVMFSNIIVLISGIFTGFIIPKILGTSNYGYYKLFGLYSSYAALLHFGFIDGILLKHGGTKYNNINKKYFKSNTIFFIFFQFIISILLISCSLVLSNDIYKILIVFLGIHTFIFNIITYYQFISQATMRFSELSFRTTLQSILMMILVFLLWIFYKFHIIEKPNYSIYISIILFVNFMLLIWYIYTYRDITFGKHLSIISNFNQIWKYFKIGFFLTMSFQVSNLILNLDSQFVSFFFNSTTFGIYSFSYSLISMMINVLNAISTVLFPHMQRSSVDYLLSIYPKLMSYISMIVYFLLLGYFPFSIIVKIFLPEYATSLEYIKILLPCVGINCSISLIIFNYYNVLNKSKMYFYLNIFILIITIILDFIIYILFKTPISLSFSTLISLLLWYMLSEFFLIKWYKINWFKNFIYIIMLIISFITATEINNIILGFIIYLFIYIFITIIIYKNYLKKLLLKLISIFN